MKTIKTETLIPRPKGFRKGQTIFNFLEWLKIEKEVPDNQNERMADPFYLDDDQWDQYYQEYLDKLESLEEKIGS